MTGRRIRLYTDQDVHARLAAQLSRSGYDILSCRDTGNVDQGLSDDWQLRFTVSERPAILVHNISDFVVLDQQWRARGEEHYGNILVPAGIALGDLVRRTRLHLDTVTPEQQYNTILYLA
jgi:hypothetical protein